MTPPLNPTLLSSSEKDALITALLAQVQTQAEQIAVLTTRVADLEAKLNLPPKTPDNSSTPPSQGHKAHADGKAKPKSKAHAGAHRLLHPHPTRRRDVLAEQCPHCHADVTGVVQVAVQAYDRIDIPEITPDVTRVTLHGGVCPCCAQRFKAPPPAGLEPGSPFGPNLNRYRFRRDRR
jgi:transposase